MIYKYFSGEPPYKIGVIAPKKDSGILPIEKLRLKGHKIDILLVENIRTYDLDYYDYIIATKEKYQKSSYVVYDTFDVKNYASICHYLDKDLTEIVVYDGADLSGTTKVYCEIPNIYIKYKGFEPYKKLIVYDYEIYKRKN